MALILFIGGGDPRPLSGAAVGRSRVGSGPTHRSPADDEQLHMDVLAEQVFGGVAADILWPGANNWGQSYDNLRFQVAIDARVWL